MWDEKKTKEQLVEELRLARRKIDELEGRKVPTGPIDYSRAAFSGLLRVQEEERRRVAGRLQDTVGSSLTAIKIALESLFEDIEKGTAGAEALLVLTSMIDQVLQEVRGLVMDLRPSMLDDIGLVATICWLCRRIETTCPGVRVQTDIDVKESAIPETLKTILFRVAQEALDNIARHSKADRARVSLVEAKQRIVLTIEDNGIGFESESVLAGVHPGGLGLTSMKERAEGSGGTISIESAVGTGTTIRASWPSEVR